MLSFRLLPVGRETFKHTLVFPGCGTASREPERKFFTGGVLKGPATNIFYTQDARTSVTAGPKAKAALEFFIAHAGRCLLWNAGTPVIK
jgi:hypothetical protein